ncbi:MAG: tetratricopeptide repeat protein [Candidatus Omnitrophica bacterium]|nr:tetratricopeptide repeat protein [Candidatus Omnitrophota bacterium]
MKVGFLKKWFNFFAAAIIVLLGTVIYSNSFLAQFTFDDTVFIRDNPYIRNIGDLSGLWNFSPPRFISFLTFAVNYHFSQLRVFGYHAVNLLIHLGSSFLVFWFMLLTFSSPALKEDGIKKYSFLLALLVALVFLAHPLQTESVTYIYQRVTSLAGFFYILSLALYAKSRLLQLNAQSPGGWIWFYLSSLVIGSAAMFTKENTVTLPFMIILYEACFFGNKDHSVRKYAAPFLLLLPVIPIALFFSHPMWKVDIVRMVSNPVTGIQYFLTQTRVLLTYMRLLFFPLNQNIDYDYSISRTLLEMPVLISCAAILITIFIAIKTFSKYRLISFAIFWFFITLLAESSIIPISDVIFEHRLYLPMVGYGIFLIAVIYYFLGEKKPYLPLIILLPVIAGYSLLTYKRNFVWQNETTLWSDAARKSPNKARPFYNLGNAYADNGNLQEAEKAFLRAYQLKPDIENANNLAAIYADQGQIDKAISIWETIVARSPNFTTAHFNLAVFYYKQGKYDPAIRHCDKLIELGNQVDPDFLKLLEPHRNK